MVAVEDLADTAVADTELAGDDAGPHTRRRHLNDLQSDVVGEGAAVDEHPSKLVYPALTWRMG